MAGVRVRKGVFHDSEEKSILSQALLKRRNFHEVEVNFHSKCKIPGGVTEFFGKAFLCHFLPGNLPRPVVYSVHSLPIQVTLGDS